MQGRTLLLGLLLVGLTTGCPKVEEMADMAAPPDMKPGCPGEASLPIGSPCTTKNVCQCEPGETANGDPDPKNVACLTQFEDSMGTQLDVEGGYCSNKAARCTPGKSAGCPPGGTCVSFFGSSAQCYKKCTRKGQCAADRADYACLTMATDPNDSMVMPATSSICMPKFPELVDCNPAGDPTKECLRIGTTEIAGLTDGNPNAACWRRGNIDDVGQCSFIPCRFGPKNCPSFNGEANSCYYLDFSRFRLSSANPDPTDKAKGGYCLGSGTKKLGEACMFIDDCGDNMFCANDKTGKAVCSQACYNGMQNTYPGGAMMNGMPLYKNDPAPCPGTATCTNIFNVQGSNWPGACVAM